MAAKTEMTDIISTDASSSSSPLSSPLDNTPVGCGTDGSDVGATDGSGVGTSVGATDGVDVVGDDVGA